MSTRPDNKNPDARHSLHTTLLAKSMSLNTCQTPPEYPLINNNGRTMRQPHTSTPFNLPVVPRILDLTPAVGSRKQENHRSTPQSARMTAVSKCITTLKIIQACIMLAHDGRETAYPPTPTDRSTDTRASLPFSNPFSSLPHQQCLIHLAALCHDCCDATAVEAISFKPSPIKRGPCKLEAS